MTDPTDLLRARAAELLTAGIPASAVGWVAHRAASSRALALIELIAEQSGDPAWIAAAGYERGTRATTAEDARLAASQLLRAMDSMRLPRDQLVLLVELLVLLRQDERISHLASTGRLSTLSELRQQMLEADLANPIRTPGLSERTWLQTIAPLFGDLAPITLGPMAEGGDQEPIDRLSTQLAPGTVRGDLVTVVVSSYRPGSALDTSVRSILAQTWADLEVLVVDDASGAEFSRTYERIAALDQRVRVIRQRENGGTYVARNTAIDQARGTYITFQDADDWSHPERIERQVAAFESDFLIHSVRAQSLRTPGSLVFSRQGSAVRAPAAATLMFRRQQVWPVLGGYDVVRKAADTEFHERISAALPGYTLDLDVPLMWVRLGDGSLSRSEFRASWKHPARLLYRSAWAHWHREIRRGTSPRLDREVRPFPAPHRFRPDRTAPADQFDLVVLGDWRGDRNAARDAIGWIRILAADGARIALVHAESLDFEGRLAPELMPSVQEMVAAGTVEAVPWDDPVKTNAIVVIEPEVLEFLPDTEPGTNAPAMVVLLDAAPRAAAAIAFTESIITKRWGSRTVWSPRGAAAVLPHASAEMLSHPFPAFMPAEVRRPLHRPQPVVVVAPIGIAPDVLDHAAKVIVALADAGLDVRVRVSDGVRQVIRDHAGVVPPGVFWGTSLLGAAATETALATDLIIIGTEDGIEVDRMIDDARVWGVCTHLRGSSEHDGAGLGDLVERIAAGSPTEGSATDPSDAAATASAVRAWFEEISALG